MTAIDFQLDQLAQERLRYSQRLKAIVGQPGCEAEIAGYLVLIQRVNDAAIQFARRSSDHAFHGTRC
jgi:hypothetical protein